MPADRKILEQFRYFLKDSIRKQVDFSQTDQNRGVAPPPIEKPFSPEAVRIDLAKFGQWRDIPGVDLAKAIRNRKSRRVYTRQELSLDELSFLLWATQGIRTKVDEGHAYRTVPSAGCRHALETYLGVVRVKGLLAGIYRYLPLEHQLLLERADENIGSKIVGAIFGQPYPEQAAVTFVWTAVPYRMEWRYSLAAAKVIALDAGHVCQNLYLACEAIGAGTCAVAAYDQEAMDRLLRVDGKEEFTIYLASVGKRRKTDAA
ncbi:MAG: SagB/ThcOx family dehydrogenase [Syntrophaceae bacterium]|nr:SagB/ThcOx family dehydrogenase [Syntrophaceae bacterium]